MMTACSFRPPSPPRAARKTALTTLSPCCWPRACRSRSARRSAELAVAAGAPRRTAQLVVDLRGAAAESAPDPGRVRKVLETVRQIAIGAASVPAGAGLLDLVEKAAHALGL